MLLAGCGPAPPPSVTPVAGPAAGEAPRLSIGGDARAYYGNTR
ncbi:hypothetical protein [Roseicella aquatilis]|nr:hypothetical protein [Roseicella aquatilis]